MFFLVHVEEEHPRETGEPPKCNPCPIVGASREPGDCAWETRLLTMASAITSRPSPGAPGKKRGVADLAKSAVNTRSATAAAALAPVLGSRDDSSAEASAIDPFARLRVQPGLGNVSRLKGETIACDTMMEKYTPRQTSQRFVNCTESKSPLKFKLNFKSLNGKTQKVG